MKYYCINNCGKEVSGKNRKCRSCSKSGKNNPAFGGHKKDCNCVFCKMKRKELVGNKAPNYKDGRNKKIFYCNCGNIINTHAYLYNNARKCINCANKLKNLGRKRPDASLRMKGENHWNWKGGITNLRVMIRLSNLGKLWIKKVFERDNYTCQSCGKLGVELEAHHKKAFSLIFDEFLKLYDQFSPIEDKETLFRLAIKYKPFWDIDNGVTLCKRCHNFLSRESNKLIRGTKQC